MSEKCAWLHCKAEAFCASGNVAGALVCREHFQITNGKSDEELTPYERWCMATMVEKKLKPVCSTLEDEPVKIPRGALVKLNPKFFI